MKLRHPDSFVVESGVGFASTDPARPGQAIVVLDVEEDGESVRYMLTPTAARRVGIDLISCAIAAMAEAGARDYAKRAGVDGDEIIGAIKRQIRDLLDAERT